MSSPLSWRRWLSLPSRLALLLGVGALSAAGAKAGIAESPPAKDLVRVPQQSAKNFGELRIWSEEGRIYVSEGGRNAEELRLTDTPQARHLRQLLEQDGVGAGSPRLLHSRIILVGGGGDGFHWAPAGKADNPAKRGAAAKTGNSSKGDNRPNVTPLAPAPTVVKTRNSEAENTR